MEQKLHTPEGVRDIYGDECKQKLTLLQELNEVLHQYGYQDIQTPTFEYFDVFRKEIGTIPAQELYKFFDPDGNTLALRPDLTPSIARAVATLFETEDDPIRLCYTGNTFINHSSYQGRLKESTQLGAELIGLDSIEADAEMIAMLVEGLKNIGLTEFQVNIGHVDFIQSLVEAASLSEETKEDVQQLIANRNFFGVEEAIENENASADVIHAFKVLPELVGDTEVLDQAMEIAPDERAQNAIDHLKKMYEILRQYEVEDHVTFDLSMSGNYGYYTGIIFSGYTYGTGDAIARGGRYDHLLEKFGKDLPSIGFAILIDELMNALSRQKISVPCQERSLIVYTDTTLGSAISLAKKWRNQGAYIELIKGDLGQKDKLLDYADRTLANHIVFISEDQTLTWINVKTGEESLEPQKISSEESECDI